MSDQATITVEVAYALPQKQAIVELQVSEGTTAEQAVAQSRMDDRFEGLTFADAKLGIFGKAVAGSQVLRAGDRVEIYRPLIADPKEVRKARAAKAKEKRAGA